MTRETPKVAPKKAVAPTALLIVSDDPARWQAAIATALANAALGRRTSFYIHDQAVRMLATHTDAVRDLTAMGIRVIACQSGIAACDLRCDDLPAGIEAGGLISFLAEIGDDRLVVF